MRRLIITCILAVSAASAVVASEGVPTKDSAHRQEADQKAPAPVAKGEEPGMMSKATTALINTSNETIKSVQSGALRVRELFDTILPGALGKNHLLFDFEPKAGDFTKREFVRFPFELRYGLSDKTEIYGGLTPVMPNPFKSGPDHRWGPGMAKLGARRDLVFENFYFPKIAIGLEGTAPVGKPPVDLIDHYIHVKPYATASRQLHTWPDTTLFVALSYDRAVNCPNRENIPAIVIRRHVTEIAPGLLYKPNEFGAFAQYSLLFYDEPLHQRLKHEAKMGFLWDMPLERSRQWNLPGKFQWELGYKISNEDGIGTEHGVLARVRWKLDLKHRVSSSQ